MPAQHRLPVDGVRADPWTLFCAGCSQKMKIMMATPAQGGRETHTYECACGHSETINGEIRRSIQCRFASAASPVRQNAAPASGSRLA